MGSVGGWKGGLGIGYMSVWVKHGRSRVALGTEAGALACDAAGCGHAICRSWRCMDWAAPGSWGIPVGAACAAQVSGIRFQFDPSKPPGSRVVPGSVWVAGAPLDPERQYRVGRAVEQLSMWFVQAS